MCGKSCQVRKKAAVTSIFQVGWPYIIMQNSKVLALKYRPQNLNELVGQELVAETIYNSIKSNKIPNAFLFTGIRGVGKTTIARIIAKSLNCKYKGTLLNEIFDAPLPEKINDLSKEKIIPLFYLILECDDISALGEYEDNSDFTNNTGDAPDDIGFREITDDTKSEIEWSSEVIKYDTL